MKNKILASLTVLCAALVLVGGFSVTAYAQTPTEETDDSGVIVETEPQPLTPEGNMTLVDDIDGDAAEDKQFIVVKSKGGNYFYIIVDRAAEGENSVHFLNQVDESDLMAIIGGEQTEQPPAVCNCTEKCKAGEVNTACPACSVNMDSCTGKEATPEEPAEQEQPQNGMGGLLIFLVVGLLGGGAALYFLKFKKEKADTTGNDDLAEYDFGEDEDDEDEAPEPDEEYILTLCGDTVIFSSGLLAEALSRLDEREREMIYLSFFKRIPQHEIGRQYGRSRSTAGYHIRKALRQLQAEMEGMAYEK